MIRVFVVFVVVLLACGAAGTGELTDKDGGRWPRLFVAADERACWSRTDALFCQATFRVRPVTPNHTLFSRMQEYSRRVSSFDRTLLHRKYCLCAGCGAVASLSRVVSRRLRRVGLRARLAQGPQCVRAQRDGPRAGLGWLIGAAASVLGANLAGLAYDLSRDHNKSPNMWLLSLSPVHNWRRLTAPAPDARLAALAPLDTLRVLMSVFLVGSHDLLLSFSRYRDDPRQLEQIDERVVMFLTNATLMVEVYVVMSSLVLTYPLLVKLDGLQTVAARAKLLPRVFLNRIFRICPSYWAVLWVSRWAGPERGACRAGGLYNVLLVHPLRGPQPVCLLPTWFLATDLQLQVLIASLVVLFPRRSLLAGCTTAGLASAVVFCLSYFGDIHEIAFQMNYEVLRTRFAHSRSFWWTYASCWGNVGAALCGAGLAGVLRGARRRRWDKLLTAISRMPPLLCVVWVGAALWVRPSGGALGVALYSALARPLGGAVAALFLYAVIYKLDPCWRWCWLEPDSPAARITRVLSRSSLALSLVHWPVSQLLPHTYHVVWSAAASWCASWLLAVGSTLLLQMTSHALLMHATAGTHP